MTAVIIQHAARDAVRIPSRVADLASFRRWAKSDDFPERGWYSHLNGELWVDLSMETLAHNQVKGEVDGVLRALAKQTGGGRFFGDRMRLTHVGARLSTEPDGMFVSYASLQARRVRLAEGARSLEVEGSPDMVLEVVSPTSEHKDTVLLRDLYWRAGVREYWLADARGDELGFDLLKHGRKGFTATRRQAGGWLPSAVFGKSFRLTQQTDPLGVPVYSLDVR